MKILWIKLWSLISMSFLIPQGNSSKNFPKGGEEERRHENLWHENLKENDILYQKSGEYIYASPPYGEDEESCLAQIKEIDKFRQKLNHVKQTLLDGIECGDGNCSQILILSKGTSALRQAPRFGVYTLQSMYQGFPVYYRYASQQYLFYKEEYDKWDYSYRTERWIIGPRVGDSEGGVIFVSNHKCPWEIDFTYKDRAYYYDKLDYNIWNSEGNGWKPEDKISIKCYKEELYPFMDCCSTLNITSDDRVLQYHPEKIGIYQRVHRPDKLGFQISAYKMEGRELYLYSHHPSGHLWLLGSSYQTWSLRLNLLSNQDQRNLIYCPDEPLPPGGRWEYLYSTNKQGDQVWLKDDGLKIQCLRY